MKAHLHVPLVVLVASSLVAAPAFAARAPDPNIPARLSVVRTIDSLEFFRACRGCGHPKGGTFSARWARATGQLTFRNFTARTRLVDCIVTYSQEMTYPLWMEDWAHGSTWLVGKDWVSARVKSRSTTTRDWWILGADENGNSIIDLTCTA